METKQPPGRQVSGFMAAEKKKNIKKEKVIEDDKTTLLEAFGRKLIKF